jgi:flagella basal body P-ring formation protein FlgA
MRSCADLRGIVRVALALALIAGAAPARAAVPAALEARVGAAVAARWGVAPGDVRLEWPRTTPSDSLPPDAAVTIAGEGSDGWMVARVTAPAGTRALRVRAGATDTVWVVTRALVAGTSLGAGDLRLEARPCWGPPRAAAGGDLAGWETRRALSAGEVIARLDAVPPRVVAPGDPVRMTWCRGGVRIALAGTALNAARRGEALRVRIEGRTEPLTGVASGPGTADLGSGGVR